MKQEKGKTKIQSKKEKKQYELSSMELKEEINREKSMKPKVGSLKRSIKS